MRALVLALVTCIAATPASAAYIGALDSVDKSLVKGWTCNTASPNTQLTVHLYATAVRNNRNCHMQGADSVCYTGGGLANVIREPAVQTACGGTTSAHGFEIVTPGYVVDGSAHRVYAYPYTGGASSPLSSSPLTFASTQPTRTVLLAQPTVSSNIADYIVQDPTVSPNGQFKIDVHYTDPNVVSSPLPNNNVGDFTGLYVPSPAETWQHGINPNWYGGFAIQGNGTWIGMLHNPDPAQFAAGYKPAFGCGGLNTIGPVFNMPNWIRPWATSNQSRLRMTGTFLTQAAGKTTNAISCGATVSDAVYWILVMKFRDTTCPNQPVCVAGSNAGAACTSDVNCPGGHCPSCRYVWLGASAFDLGRAQSFDPASGNYVQLDQYGIPIIESFLGANSRYVTKAPSTSDGSTSPWPNAPRVMGFDVHGDAFADGLAQIVATLPGYSAWSVNPRDYVLDHINITDENFLTTSTSDAWVGLSFSGLTVSYLTY